MCRAQDRFDALFITNNTSYSKTTDTSATFGRIGEWSFLTILILLFSTQISTTRLIHLQANLPEPRVGPLVALYRDTAVSIYQTGAPESSNFVLLSNLVSPRKHRTGALPRRSKRRFKGPNTSLRLSRKAHTLLGRQAEA